MTMDFPVNEIKLHSESAININNQIYLLGAKHLNPDHILLTEDQLQYLQPDLLMVEIDPQILPEIRKFYASFANAKEITQYLSKFGSRSTLSSMEQLALVQFTISVEEGVLPLQEFMAPAEFAKSIGVPVKCIDLSYMQFLAQMSQLDLFQDDPSVPSNIFDILESLGTGDNLKELGFFHDFFDRRVEHMIQQILFYHYNQPNHRVAILISEEHIIDVLEGILPYL